ncbi:MAG TPA: hypothetical protein PLB96_00035 [Syntrophales bacterium]|nr:hypothetical protein [Syntrophales bacterium]
MREPLRLFDPIPLQPPNRRIYRRLGYRQGVTKLSPGERVELERWIAEAAVLIRLKGAAKRLSLIRSGEGEVAIAGGPTWRSRDLAAFVGGAGEIVLLAATAGPQIAAAVRRDAGGEMLKRGVVFDAVGSEMTDAALDWIAAFCNRTLRREGMGLSRRRYSAGYGDFSLAGQADIYRLLEMERWGVRITDSFMLEPEKSVTAVAVVQALKEGTE